MKQILMVLLCVQNCYFISIAQIEPAQQLRFNYLGIKDGLPESLIKTLQQDREGYIWIGTQNGLIRFDGYNLKKYRFNLRDENSNNVSITYEDKDANLWVGTYNGLYYYDRKKDTVLEQSLFSSFYNQKKYLVQFIQIDGNNNIWLQLLDGEKRISCLGFLDRKSKHFIVFSNDEKGKQYLNTTRFYSSFVDKQSNFWVESDNCLLKYTQKSKRFESIYFDTAHQDIYWYENEDSLNHDDMWFLFKDKKSTKCKGIGKYNIITNTFKTFPHSGIEPDSAFGSIAGMNFTDLRKQVWFATLDGLTTFDPLTESFTDFTIKEKKIHKNDNAVLWAEEDKGGNIWCWGAKGMLRFNTTTQTFTRYVYNEAEVNGILSNDIYHIALDQQGSVWFGVTSLGLQWLNRDLSKFTLYKNELGYKHNFPGGTVNSFSESPDGTFWLGSDHGLYHWQPELDSFTLIRFTKDAAKDVNVGCVMLANDGMLWFSAHDDKDKLQGLYCYNPFTKKTINYRYQQNNPSSLANNSVNTIFQDNSGTIWVGLNYGGLCRFNKKDQTFTRYPFIIGDKIKIPKSDSLDDAALEVIYQDKQKTLWLGTQNGGLSAFYPQASRFISYLNKLPGLFTIMSIYEDTKNNIWAGTYYGGLFLLNKRTGSLKKYSERANLLYDGSWGINEDKNNNVWVISPKGISILNSETNIIRTIIPGNGLLEYPTRKGLYKTSKGLFLYGCANGFIEFNPDNFTPDTAVPVMHIESISFYKSQKNNSKELDSLVVRYNKNEINLRYNENRVTFNYVGLMYQNTSLVKYAYKLDGFDKGWIQAGAQRNATYTNLSAGIYTFHVKAANSDGVWATKEDTLTIIISPPWWKTWWAYLLYSIAFAAAVWSFIVYRSRNLTRQNVILEQKVTQRTSQLNHSLQELKSTQAQLIQSEKMASLGDLTAGIAHEIQNPLNFVTNFSELNRELLEELKEEAGKGNMSEVKTIAKDVIENEEKINYHGKRADSIVKGMLQHSRQTKGAKEPTDINALCDEFLRLSYHGLRAKDKLFNAEFTTHFDKSIGKISIVPQDIGRVLLNLFNNAFYAVNERRKQLPDNSYQPMVKVTTQRVNGNIEIRVDDNGNGIPQNIIDKIFQPFFTTKPTGQGTGLGLSLSYDIVTKEHGGTIKTENKEGEGITFIIQLPF